MEKYYVGCGDGFLEQQNDNSFTYTTVKENAFPFKTLSAAKNVIKCAPKWLTNRGLFIIIEKEDEPKVISEAEPLSVDSETLSKELQSILEAFNGFSTELTTCWNNKEAYEAAVSNADKETLDLLHEIELEKFNVVEGYHLAKRLQDIRKVRRQYKDNLRLIAMIDELGLTSITNGRLHESLLSFQTREYHPRVKQSMFDEREPTQTIVTT